ncbi:MAG: InlB B-repeat-containing protein, partial [Tissierellia bacterium]|nr:InlB B-repeat-containing protein [Tissierellia bacterium]
MIKDLAKWIRHYKNGFTLFLAFIMILSVFASTVYADPKEDLKEEVNGVFEPEPMVEENHIHGRDDMVRNIITPVDAIWTYEFYVEGNLYYDNISPLHNPQYIRNNQELIEPRVPEKKDYVFVGWYEDIDDESTKVQFGVKTGITEDKTIKVYAKFEEEIRVFFENDGNIIASKKVNKGDTVNTNGVPIIVTADGKVFSHWSKVKDGPGSEIAFDFDNTPILETTTLYAILKNGYQVEFETHGGSSQETLLIDENDSLEGKVSDATRDGYDFKHWSLAENGPSYQMDSPVVSNLKLHAVWTPKGATPYTVVYWQENADDDNYTYIEQTTKTGSSGAQAEYDIKIYDGFTFDPVKTGVTPIIQGDGTTIVNVFYSRDRYTLEFRELNANSAISGLKFENVKWGSVTDEQWNIAEDLRRGYVWSEKKDGSSPWYSGAPDMPKKDLVLYGKKWGKNTFVVFYVDNATDEEIKDSYVFNHSAGTLYTTIEDYIAIPGFEVIVPDHDPNNTSIELFEYNEDTNQSEVTIKYNRLSYRIIFHNDVNNSNHVTEDILYQADISDKALAGHVVGVTTKLINGIEHVFGGWYNNEGLAGDPFVFAGKTMPAGDLPLYAKWKKPVHEITVYKSINSSENYTFNVEHNKQISDDELDEMNSYHEIEADDFVGWFYYLNEKFTRFDLETPIIKDLELYPASKFDIGTVTYDVGIGGSGVAPIEEKYVKGTTMKLPSSEGMIAPENKIFLGWIIDGGDGTVYQPGEAYTVNSDVKFVATWGFPNSPTKIIYRSNGGLPSEDKVIDLGNNAKHEILAKDTFSKVGYTFKAWKDANGKEYKPGEMVLVDRIEENVNNILDAVWIKNIDFTATKNWQGDENVDRPTLNFTLYRKVEGGTEEIVKTDAIGQNISSVKEIDADNISATWNNLLPIDNKDKNYIYFVKEEVKVANVLDQNWVFG